MRQILWLSLIPLTAFWLFELRIYGFDPLPQLGVLSIIIGIAISIFGSLDLDVISNRKFALLLIPIGFSSLIIPFPYNAGLIVTAIALSLSILAPETKALWLGTLLGGIILIIDALFLAIYYILASSYHQAGWLSTPISFLFNLIGLGSAPYDGIIYIYSQEMTFPFTITYEKLGLYPWILIFAGTFILLFITSQNRSAAFKRILSALLISVLYLMLRYVLLVDIFLAVDMPEFAAERFRTIFIDPVWLIISFVPIILIFLILYPIQNFKLDLRLDVNRRLVIVLATIFVGIFCLTAAAIFQDPGIKKEGRILVDEIHSVWEFSTLKLDKEWYGENSTYNSYSMVEWLKDNYQVDRLVDTSYKNWTVPGATKVVPDLVSDNITNKILDNYDILIIKTPSHFKPEEVEAIVHFVERGGGLLLIGDHTNFAGTGSNLNQISKRFGIEFGYDSVNAINDSLYHYSRGSLPHPIVKYMPYMDFMTGCSLNIPLDGEPVILGFGVNSEPGEYATEGFFRETRINDPTRSGDTTWGLINQAVAIKYGKGRVIAFADSTQISNFRIFFGGIPNFIIGSMEYLNYKNSFENTKQILLLAGIIFLGLGACLIARKAAWRDRKLMFLLLLLAIGVLATSGALILFSTKAEYSIPSQFYMKNHTISFDGGHSGRLVNEADSSGELGDMTGDYETFLVWTQRVGFTPSIENTLEESLARARVVVIAEPIKNFSQNENIALKNYVKDGNSVLLMINTTGNGSYLAHFFGMDTYYIKAPNNSQNGTHYQNASIQLPIKPWGLAIKGGKPLLSIADRVVLAEAIYGKGKLVLFTDSQVFKSGFDEKPGCMGYSNTDPKSVQDIAYNLSSLYNLEYHILEDVLTV